MEQILQSSRRLWPEVQAVHIQTLGQTGKGDRHHAEEGGKAVVDRIVGGVAGIHGANDARFQRLASVACADGREYRQPFDCGTR